MIQQPHFWISIPNHLNQDLKDICTPVFIATLYIIAKVQKEHKCAFLDE
jgi:hypothetical protein